jgi:hypothetical protein
MRQNISRTRNGTASSNDVLERSWVASCCVCDYDWRQENVMNLGARVALCICWSVAMPVFAEADDRPWVFVPLARGGLPVARAAALTAAWEAEFIAQGEHVLPNDDAVEQVRAYSMEPPQLSAAERESIKRRLSDAQGELAVRPSSTTHVLQELSPAQRDAIAQDPLVAHQMEAVCLTQLEYEVRSRGKIQSQAQFCRELFPSLRPDEGVYPPPVREALNAVGRVDVQVDGPAGCRVLLNGREVGTSPATLHVFPVRARVQLTCDGSASRVHSVLLGERKRLAVDPAADAVLRTDRGLYIVGVQAPSAMLEQLLGARVITLATQIVDGRIRVQVAGPKDAADPAILPLWFDLQNGYAKKALAPAVRQLIGENVPPAKVIRSVNPVLAGTVVSERNAGDELPLGPVLLGSGGAAMLAGSLVTGLLGAARDADVRQFAASCPAPCVATLQQRRGIEQAESEATALYTATVALAVGGGVVLGAAVGWFFLRDSFEGSASVAVLPWASPRAMGADVVGRF